MSTENKPIRDLGKLGTISNDGQITFVIVDNIKFIPETEYQLLQKRCEGLISAMQEISDFKIQFIKMDDGKFMPSTNRFPKDIASEALALFGKEGVK